MPKFQFKMDKLLSIKKQLEKSKQNDLANALREVRKNEEILADLREEKEIHIENVKKSSAFGISVQKFKEMNNYIKFCEEKIKKQKKVLNDVKKVADNIREELIKVSKEKKALETLREKKYDQYIKEEQKKEELLVSEFVNFEYTRDEVGERDGNQSTRKN